MKNTLKYLNKKSIFASLIVIGITVLLVHILSLSHAQTPYATIEAETGAISSPAAAQQDGTASGGRSVKFCSSITTSLAIKISNGQLINEKCNPIRLLGAMASGTSDACVMSGKGYGYGGLNKAEADSMLTWHINAVRVLLNEDCWLGINGAPVSYSAQSYQTAITNWVNALNSDGIYVILDLQSSAPGSIQSPAVNQWPMADQDHSPTFWTQVASTFKNNPAVIFDLFNEPFRGGIKPTSSDWQCWLNGCINNTLAQNTTTVVPYQIAGMQELVDKVRATGAAQPIMVGGLNWSGDPCGLRNTGGNNGQCSQIANMPKDPLNQLALSFHTYNWTSCIDVPCWDAVAAGAKAANYPIITGEFGERDCSVSFNNLFMNWADQNNVSYLAQSWVVYYIPPGTSPIPCSNLFLISDWAGAPSTSSPSGANYKTHLASTPH